MVMNSRDDIDFYAACLLHMESNSLPYKEKIISDGRYHRYSSDDSKRKQDKWYIAHEDVLPMTGNRYFICTYGSWSTGEKFTYYAYNGKRTQSEEREFARVLELRRAEIEKTLDVVQIKLKKDGAERARAYYDQCSLIPCSEDHTRYFKVNGIKSFCHPEYPLRYTSYHGVDVLVIPVLGFAEKLELYSLLFIYYQENEFYKRFMAGCSKRGNFYPLGSFDDKAVKIIYVVEDYATGASIYEARKDEPMAVFVVFDTDNIFAVVESLRARISNIPIVIAPDYNERSIGSARSVADAFSCIIAVPASGIREYKNFNEMHQVEGLATIRTILLEAFNAYKNTKKVPISKNTDTFMRSMAWNLEEPCSDFKLDYFPGELREYCEHLCEGTCSHPIIVTISLLATLSGFMANRFYHDFGSNIKLYSNFWAVCISPSGTLKSTGMNLGSRLAQRNQKRAFDKLKYYKQLFNKQEITDQQYSDSCITTLQNSIMLPESGSIAGLLDHLSGGAYGVIYCDEFSSFIKNLRKKFNFDGAELLTQLYGVPETYSLKTKTQGSLQLERPFISICGVTTSDWLEDQVRARDIAGGFWPRFLFFTPPTMYEVPPAFPPACCIDEQLESRIYAAASSALRNEIRAYGRTQEAEHLQEQIHKAIYSHIKKFNDVPLLREFSARWSTAVIKLALIMEYFIDMRSTVLSRSAIEASFSIVKPAIDSTIKLLSTTLMRTAPQRKLEQLFQYIVRKYSENDNQAISRKKVFTSRILDTGRDYEEYLDTLEGAGRIKCEIKHPKMDSLYWPLCNEDHT
jgi:hypothetical protein